MSLSTPSTGTSGDVSGRGVTPGVYPNDRDDPPVYTTEKSLGGKAVLLFDPTLSIHWGTFRGGRDPRQRETVFLRLGIVGKTEGLEGLRVTVHRTKSESCVLSIDVEEGTG